MRFGIYAEMQCPDDKPFAALYDDVVRQMAHASAPGRAAEIPSASHRSPGTPLLVPAALPSRTAIGPADSLPGHRAHGIRWKRG